MGSPNLLSQGETAGNRSDAVAVGKSPFQDETEFCNDKGTTCLTNPATQFDVLQGSFYDKITVEIPLGKKYATEIFDARIF